MDINEIKEYLPHRYPFLFVDKVLTIEENVSIAAVKNVSTNEPHFNGHFPDFPIMPGVLIIEALAQAAGILGFKSMGKKPADGSVYYLVGTENMRFRRPVIPGDQLLLEAKVVAEKRGIWKFDCRASVDGEEVCAGLLICADRKKQI